MLMTTPTSLSPTTLLMALLVDFRYLILLPVHPFSTVSKRSRVLSVPLVSTRVLSLVVTSEPVLETSTTLLFGVLSLRLVQRVEKKEAYGPSKRPRQLPLEDRR
jgi:hypothetical protein